MANDTMTFKLDPITPIDVIEPITIPKLSMQQILNRMYGIEQAKDEKSDAPKEEEKWIWIEGYKGTDKNMTCRDFKFDFGTVFSIPDDKPVIECRQGFHLCLELKDVFGYYDALRGNRFFKVKALVKEGDYKEKVNSKWKPGIVWFPDNDKIVAKSIEFISECSDDEILTAKGIDCSDWTIEEKREALTTRPGKIQDIKRIEKLVTLGYSQPFARYVVHHTNGYGAAVAAASQPGLSMDMKCLMILHGEMDD
jgi:hypothetical protein